MSQKKKQCMRQGDGLRWGGGCTGESVIEEGVLKPGLLKCFYSFNCNEHVWIQRVPEIICLTKLLLVVAIYTDAHFFLFFFFN